MIYFPKVDVVCCALLPALHLPNDGTLFSDPK
jgi:hypothetical protein